VNAQVQSQAIALDAPIEGWDAYSSLDNMPPTAAIILDNLIPGPGRVDTRKGSLLYVDLGTAAPVESVASLDNESLSKFLCASDGGLFDITDNQSVVTLQPTTTFSNDRWQHKNFRKSDENGILILCNGVDNTQIWGWDGGVDFSTTRDLIDTNVVGTDFIGVEVYKGRAYYWKDNDNAFYYAQAGSYEGDLKKFDLGSFTQRGGKLVMITTWTQQDSGDGRDDFIVFVFSTGEILVYQGDDPDAGGFWEMVGRYLTAEPLSVRGRDKYGSDIIIMTKDGYVNLATIVQKGRTSDVPEFSRMIHNAIKQRVNSREDLYGWDCSLFPKEGLFVFNVPLSNETFEQHVLNTVTMRWCRFTNVNVNCLDVHDERLFGGTADGKVLAIMEGANDQGIPIDFTALYGFNYLGNPGVQNLLAAQIISTHPDPSFIQINGFADFNFPVAFDAVQAPQGLGDQGVWSVAPAPGTGGSLWDEDFWSVTDTPFTTKGWQNCSAYGYAVSLLVRFALVDLSVAWRSTGARYYYAGSH
jgi:hypothetical protein